MVSTDNITKQPIYLPFEDKIADIDKRIAELKEASTQTDADHAGDIRILQREQTAELKKIYSNLVPSQTVQVSRHPQRPLFMDYMNLMVKDARELHGDRCFGDDRAMLTYLGQIGRERVMIIGQNKGRDIKEKIECNFGCPQPEGYRKALAKMKFAEKYGLPIVTLIDTPGAYPGIGAEERGQAQAIALNLMEMSRLKVPIICIVIGEGGSGGALGIGVGDRLAMLEHAYYSVISPEGCAAILWRDGTKADLAADALRLTSKELMKMGLIDAIVNEPLGGAHRNIHNTVYNVETYITRTLQSLKRTNIDTIVENRYQKLRAVGSQTKTRQRTTEVKPSTKTNIPSRVSAKAQLEKSDSIPAENKETVTEQ